MKKVSIIVPVYKVEKYLAKCVDSIIAQTYENIEIILVDDGSPDNSGVICDQYKDKDERIKVIHQKNMGLSGARNTGIDNSTGDYLMFIDSDDYIDPEMVSYLANKLETENADIAVCDYYDVVGDEIRTNSYPKSEFVISDNSKYLNLFNEYTIVTVIACNKLYKKSVFAELRYPVGKTHEDEYLIAEVLSKADMICYSLKPLYYYIRQREDSIMNSYSEKKFDFIYAFDHRAEFFEKAGLNDMKDLTVYSKINMLIKRMPEYIELCQNPDREFIKKKLQETEAAIKQLSGSKTLDSKRKIKLLTYKLLPSLYNKNVVKWFEINRK